MIGDKAGVGEDWGWGQTTTLRARRIQWCHMVLLGRQLYPRPFSHNEAYLLSSPFSISFGGIIRQTKDSALEECKVNSDPIECLYFQCWRNIQFLSPHKVDGKIPGDRMLSLWYHPAPVSCYITECSNNSTFFFWDFFPSPLAYSLSRPVFPPE